jgi:hypothetical protein
MRFEEFAWSFILTPCREPRFLRVLGHGCSAAVAYGGMGQSRANLADRQAAYWSDLALARLI